MFLKTAADVSWFLPRAWVTQLQRQQAVGEASLALLHDGVTVSCASRIRLGCREQAEGSMSSSHSFYVAEGPHAVREEIPEQDQHCGQHLRAIVREVEVRHPDAHCQHAHGACHGAGLTQQPLI